MIVHAGGDEKLVVNISNNTSTNGYDVRETIFHVGFPLMACVLFIHI